MSDALTAEQIEMRLRDELGLSRSVDLIAHVHLPALGPVKGEAEAVASAILSAAGTVILPAFTYQTQIIPQVGPPDNAIEYGTGDTRNAKAEIFRPDLPVHPDCGSVSEYIRQQKGTLRSSHPVLSFIARGPDARAALAMQTRQNPLAPIAWLAARGGFVLLIGRDQRYNFSLHLAEQRAGRKTFTRWALTLDDIEELPNMPGCSEGFNAIWKMMIDFTHVAHIGLARCELIPLEVMLRLAEAQIKRDPNFMLCDKPSCLSCRAREA